MEFGARALGCRSILADPRDSSMKERLNRAVKFRESFRPFAPAIKFQAFNQFFETSGVECVPYMEKTLQVKESARNLIPACVHEDGSARAQTVKQDEVPELYKLLEAFEKETEIPVLLNTSFNVNGEPIVESPRDALRTFFSSGLDALVIGHCVVTKRDCE